jgi:predicted  nucleic acid-binding Zn-ribbon protein
MLRERLREKDEVLEKKSKLLNALHQDKKDLETELAKMCERFTAKETEIATFQRQVSRVMFMFVRLSSGHELNC